MNESRALFLEVSRISRAVVAADEVGRSWDGPSALAKFSVLGLAGHLVRATGSVEAYLDRDEPGDVPVSAAAYYAQAVGETDIDSPLHVAIRERGEAQAAGGHEALVSEFDALLDRLTDRLGTERAGRKLRVYQDLVLTLDDYLATRLVEIVVHIDDLCISVDLAIPAIPQAAYDVVTDTLVGVARIRHGNLAIVRALTRRERDRDEALRVL